MVLVLKLVSALAIALWFGAMAFFSAVVAPSAFAALPTSELAGNVVNAVMGRLHVLAYGAGAVLLASYALRAAFANERHRLTAIKAGIAAVMLGIALYSGIAVSGTMAQLRAEHHAITQLPSEDPVRVRFNALHKLSVSLMGANLLLGLALLALEQVEAKS